MGCWLVGGAWLERGGMNTKRLPWFRMYTDFLNDPKMISLAFEDQRHFIGILALKSDGALESDVEEALMDRIVAQRLWIDHGVIRDVKKRLVNAGLITFNWHPVAWAKRQMNSDKDETNAQRQQQYRDSHKTVKLEQNALHNGSVTRIDTEGDKDKDTDETSKEVGFASFWQTYPKKIAKPAALKAYRAAKVKDPLLGIILSDIETRKQSDDWTKENGKYIPNPATYLNQRRWEDGETAHTGPLKVNGILAGAI